MQRIWWSWVVASCGSWEGPLTQGIGVAKSALSTTGRGKITLGRRESEFEDARKDSLDEGRWEIGPIAAAAVIANLDTQTRG